MPTTADIPQTEREAVEQWRLHVLVETGYPLVLAENLAHHEYVDLHRAVDLISRGCSFRTAAEILL